MTENSFKDKYDIYVKLCSTNEYPVILNDWPVYAGRAVNGIALLGLKNQIICNILPKQIVSKNSIVKRLAKTKASFWADIAFGTDNDILIAKYRRRMYNISLDDCLSFLDPSDKARFIEAYCYWLLNNYDAKNEIITREIYRAITSYQLIPRSVQFEILLQIASYVNDKLANKLLADYDNFPYDMFLGILESWTTNNKNTISSSVREEMQQKIHAES